MASGNFYLISAGFFENFVEILLENFFLYARVESKNISEALRFSLQLCSPVTVNKFRCKFRSKRLATSIIWAYFSV